MIHAVAALWLATSAFPPQPARAGDGGAPQATLSELRDEEKRATAYRDTELRRLENGVAGGLVGPDAAADRRFRIEQEYQQTLQRVDSMRGDALRALESRPTGDPRQGAASSGARGGAAALPRIQSQSVITFPAAGSDAPGSEPSRESRQKNVGVGVREQEF